MSDPVEQAADLLERTERLRDALAQADAELLQRALAERESAFARLAAATQGGAQPEATDAVARLAAASEALLEEARRELARAAEALEALGEMRRALHGFQGPAPEARFVSFRA